MGWSAGRSRGLAPQPAVDSASVVNTGAWGPQQVPVGGTTGFRATLSAFVQMSVLFGEQILSVLHGPRYTTTSYHAQQPDMAMRNEKLCELPRCGLEGAQSYSVVSYKCYTHSQAQAVPDDTRGRDRWI